MSSASLLPICFECARLHGVKPDIGWACEAFSDGIPTAILASVHDHHMPYSGDGGMTFKSKNGEDMAPRLATDPPKSEAQRRAMWAAASGHSTLGIPSSVGKEFAETDPGGHLPARAKDMATSKWKTLSRLFREWMMEEADEPEHQGEDKRAWDSWDRKGRAASVAFTTSDGKVLLLRRHANDSHRPGQWGFPGGKADDEEDFEDCARREASEECGDDCAFDGISELERCRTPNDFEHVTYTVPVEKEFEPKLSDEHDDWMWAHVTDLPEPMHPGVKTTIDKVIGASDESEETKKRHEGKLSEKTREEIGTVGSSKREDMPDSDFLLPKEKKYPVKKDGKYDRSLLLAAAREARMHGHHDLAKRADEIRAREFDNKAADMALDWRGCAQLVDDIDQKEIEYAYDKESARSYDADGHLHVKDVNIAKACVNEYKGNEIPKYQELGLDPSKMYRLYRHPDELKKAVASSNGKPILNDHEPIDAETHDPKFVVGSTGTDGRWEPPFVKSELVFWPAKASREIEANTRRSLSPAYRYRADMKPGVTPDGEPYDGVMRDISFSHLAQIPEGRQGPDVVVSDSALDRGEEEEDMGVQLSPKAAMAEGMFLGHFGPKLKSAGMAMDTAVGLFNPIFSGITSKNFATQRPALDAALRAVLKSKLANDADISDVTELLQAIEGVEAGADTTTEANAGLPPYMREDPEDADDESEEEREEDDCYDRRARDRRMKLGRDETEEECEDAEESEAEMEDPPEGRRESAEDWRHADDLRREADDARRRADDSRRADDRRAADTLDRRARDARRMADDMKRRADDMKRRLGRDESEEEREKREREAEDKARDRARMHARDRRRLGRDYRKARDAHHAARDAHRKAAADWRRASDAHKAAMDGRNADDAARHARDMQKADDACRDAHDAMMKARDARHRARDARRAHDKRFGRDEPPAFSGRPNTGGSMEPITKEAMDAAISERVASAVRENDRRHREIAEARAAVRHKVGELAMDSSVNSATDVYSRALTVLGVNHTGIREVAALKRLFEIAPKPGGEQRSTGFAHDSAPVSTNAEFNKWFPAAESIRTF